MIQNLMIAGLAAAAMLARVGCAPGESIDDSAGSGSEARCGAGADHRDDDSVDDRGGRGRGQGRGHGEDEGEAEHEHEHDRRRSAHCDDRPGDDGGSDRCAAVLRSSYPATACVDPTMALDRIRLSADVDGGRWCAEMVLASGGHRFDLDAPDGWGLESGRIYAGNCVPWVPESDAAHLTAADGRIEFLEATSSGYPGPFSLDADLHFMDSECMLPMHVRLRVDEAEIASDCADC